MSSSKKFGTLIGSIDCGTSSSRFIIWQAETPNKVCFHQKSVKNYYPQEGWFEQNAVETLEVIEECIEKACEKLIELGGSPQDIVAIGVTNQRESTLVWDGDTGKPLHNFIIWSDHRTSSTVEELLESVPNNTKNKHYLKPLCGLPLSTYFSAVKLRWLVDNSKEVQSAIKNDRRIFFGTVDTWILWNLTGGVNGGKHYTDVTNASRTMLMNLESLDWDPTLIKFFGVPKNVVLPEIKSSSEVYGYMVKGPLKDCPISGILGDQQAALLGQLCLQNGEAKCTYGTGCFLLYNTGHKIIDSAHGLLTTVGYQLGPDANPVYALEGSVAVAGFCLGWLRDNIGIIDDFHEIEDLVKSVPDNGDVYFVPAFSGLYAPYWNEEARGIICGLHEETEKGHIVRAALEAVCFQVRDILDAMNQDCGFPLKKLQVDGGMTSNSFVMQWQSDLIGIEVIRPSMAETTAMGAAMAAGRAVGKWDIERIVVERNSTKFSPKISEDQREVRYNRWKMAIERSLGWDN